MKRSFRTSAALAARSLFGLLGLSSMLLLAGCGDKHEPTKPTVISAIIQTLLPPS